MVNSQERNAGNASSEPFCINGQTQPVLLGTIPLPGADCAKNQVKSHGAVAPVVCRELPVRQRRRAVFRFRVRARIPQPQQEARRAHADLDDRILRSDGAADERLRLEPVRDDLGRKQGRLRALTQELRANTDFDGPVNFMVGRVLRGLRSAFLQFRGPVPRLQSGRAELRDRQHGFEIERRLLLGVCSGPLGHPCRTSSWPAVRGTARTRKTCES